MDIRCVDIGGDMDGDIDEWIVVAVVDIGIGIGTDAVIEDMIVTVLYMDRYRDRDVNSVSIL